MGWEVGGAADEHAPPIGCGQRNRQGQLMDVPLLLPIPAEGVPGRGQRRAGWAVCVHACACVCVCACASCVWCDGRCCMIFPLCPTPTATSPRLNPPQSHRETDRETDRETKGLAREGWAPSGGCPSVVGPGTWVRPS